MEETMSQVEELRAELDELRREVRDLRASRKPGLARKKAQADEVEEDLAPTRRGFLGLAGAAAAGAVLGAVAGNAEPAMAATGGNMLIGVSNIATSAGDTTRLYCPSGTDHDDQTFRADNYTNSIVPLPVSHAVGIMGTASGTDATTLLRTGVYGRANATTDTTGGQGVFGSAGGEDNPFSMSMGYHFGVFGTAAPNNWAMYGYVGTGTSSRGVVGEAPEGVGVIGASVTGISVYAADGGRILQQPRAATGAPTTGSFIKGEMIRDAAGDMYICTLGGAPGTWRKVTAAHADYAARSGSINLLSKPVRIFDTRVTDGSVPLGTGGVKLWPGSALSLSIAGTWAQGIQVPPNAKAVLGNITTVYYDSIGWAVVYPDDAAQPATSTVNFSPTVAAVANSFTCGLSAAGKMKVLVSATTHVVIDIVGFVF